MANYVPANVYHNPITLMVDDGDPVNAAESNPRIEDVADNAEYLYQRVNAQHVSGGDHFEVQCTGGIGTVKCDVQFNAADVGTTPAFQLSYLGTPMADYRLDGNFRNQNGYYLSTGTMRLGANDFSVVRLNDIAVIDRSITGQSVFANINDANDYYAATHRIELPPGSRITLNTLAGNRPTAGGQVLTLDFMSRTAGQVSGTIESTFVLGAGTGEISTGSGALAITLAATKVYYFRAKFNNNTAGGGNEILLRDVTITFDCP